MFKVISVSKLIQTIPVVNSNGDETIACLCPKESVYTRRITPALQYLIDNRQVIVTESSDTSQNHSSKSSGSSNQEKGSVNENMNITEFNSQEEKKDFENTENKSKRGRSKKVIENNENGENK